MKAAVFRQAHEPLSIEEVDIDQPRGREVLLRTAATGVCHSDLHFVDGDMDISVFAQPGAKAAVLGHEGSGIVAAVGDKVTYVKPGDYVVCCLSNFCGNCDQCLSGRPARCQKRVGSNRATDEPSRLSQNGEPVTQFVGLSTYASEMLVHENSVVKVDRGIPLEKAAIVSCGVLTGVGAALNTAQVAPGSTVAVWGCGGVGLSVIQGARLGGARMIIGVDQFESKQDMALSLGATHFVNASEGDPVEQVRALTNGQGVDYAFEAVGKPFLGVQALQATGVGGTATMVGVMPHGSEYQFPTAALAGEKKFQSCGMGSNRFRIDIPRYLEFYRQGRLQLDDLVSRTAPLEDINEAFRAMKAGEVARTVLVFEG